MLVFENKTEVKDCIIMVAAVQLVEAEEFGTATVSLDGVEVKLTYADAGEGSTILIAEQVIGKYMIVFENKTEVKDCILMVAAAQLIEGEEFGTAEVNIDGTQVKITYAYAGDPVDESTIIIAEEVK